MSFLILQDSLMNVSTQINTVIADCNAAGLQSVCDMIPTDFSTNANADLNNVSKYYVITCHDRIWRIFAVIIIIVLLYPEMFLKVT